MLQDLLYSGAWAALLLTVPTAVLTACPKPSLAPRHACCCPWWSTHGTDISTVLPPPSQQLFLGSLQGLWPCHICPSLSFAPRALQFWDFTAIEATPSLISSPGYSHCARPQSFSLTPSCLENQYRIRDFYTQPSSSYSVMYSLGPLWTTELLCADPEETFPRRLHLKWRISFITADSSVPAAQNHGFLIRNAEQCSGV